VSQLRLNPLTGRWVTIVAERAERPTDFAPRVAQVEADPGRPCPFCPGNEEVTLPALETVDKGGTWKMRVIPNLYPAFDGEQPFAVHHRGPVHVEADASGTHEVFVLTRDHNGGIHAISDADAGEMMLVLKRRFLEHAATPYVRYTQAIINHGREAGASISHPHGQMLGMPFVLDGEPPDVDAVDLPDAGGVLVLPGHVVFRAGRDDFDLRVTAHPLSDVPGVQLRAAVDVGAVPLDDDRQLHD